MKFRIIYKIFALAFLAFIFQSRSGGPATVAGLEVTGAPGSFGNLGTCGNAGCHFQEAFMPTVDIELLDGSDPVTMYEPGKSYTVRITGTAGDGTPEGAGFQAVVLDASDSQAGSWGDVGMGAQVTDASGRSYAEHTEISSELSFELEWVAPPVSTGDVTIYSAMALVDANGNGAGDGANSATLTVSEDPGSGTNSLIREFANLSIYPNPVQNELNIEISSRMSGDFELRFVDISGKVIRIEQIEISSGTNQRNFDVSEINKGFYLIQLCGDNHIASTEMLKM